MKAPQMIMIVILCLDLGINLAKHGEDRTGASAKYNFWTTLIGNILMAAILYWGGFWGGN